MLKDNSQMCLSLSPYQGLYDAIIPQKHLLRRIKENIDFSFVNPMLRKQYCEHFGRPAKEPEMMFKLMFLKKLYSTHTNASVRAKPPTQILRDLSKQLRKEIYKNAYDLSESFPEKLSLEAGLDEKIAYTEALLSVLKEGIAACGNKKIQDLAERIRGLLDTDKIREIRSKDDEDARFGHKTPTSTFYGYKNHLAMTEERLIAGISVTLIAKTNPAVAAAADKCPLKGQCKVGKGKTHSYSITQASEKNRSRLEFEASEKFQERLKIRHRIEEKNGELKEAHGLGRADSVGLFAMEVQMQMYFTAFAANIKRITKLIALAG